MKTQDTTGNSYNMDRNTEITIWVVAVVVFLLLIMGNSASALEIRFEEEAYVDDIPFSTELLVNEIAVSKFENESYVDDIPFDTKTIYYDLMIPEFEEEAYVDDIPFKTSWIAGNTAIFNFTEESYVDDIPFSTEEVAAVYQYHISFNKVYEMPEEKEVDDIPFHTSRVVCSMAQDALTFVCN